MPGVKNLTRRTREKRFLLLPSSTAGKKGKKKRLSDSVLCSSQRKKKKDGRVALGRSIEREGKARKCPTLLLRGAAKIRGRKEGEKRVNSANDLCREEKKKKSR